MAAVYTEHRMHYQPEKVAGQPRAANSANTRLRSRAGRASGVHDGAIAVIAWDIRLMRMASALMVSLCVLLTALMLMQWLANRGVFSIDRLQLGGDLQHVSAQAVRAHAKAKISGSYFTLDLKSAQQVFEQLPWVRRAHVRRIWPHGMSVSLEAHQPIAFWKNTTDSGTLSTHDELLLNTHAEVFEANTDEVEDDIPHLAGPAGRAPHVLQMYTALNDKLQATAQKVSSLTLNARSEWEVELDDGLNLYLGRDDEKLWERVSRYMTTITQARAQLAALGQRAELARIDLRHKDGYAMALRKAAAAHGAEEKIISNLAINNVTDSKTQDTITSMSTPQELRTAHSSTHNNLTAVAASQR